MARGDPGRRAGRPGSRRRGRTAGNGARTGPPRTGRRPGPPGDRRGRRVLPLPGGPDVGGAWGRACHRAGLIARIHDAVPGGLTSSSAGRWGVGRGRSTRCGPPGDRYLGCPGRSATTWPRRGAASPRVEEGVQRDGGRTGRVRDDDFGRAARAPDRRRVAGALSPLASRRRRPGNRPTRARRLGALRAATAGWPALTGHGYGVWAMDLRGHGRTAESTGIGRFGGLGVDTVLDDVDALHLVMDDQHPGVPRVLLGHSMGSIIALASAERNEPTSPASRSPDRSVWPCTSRTRSPLWRRPSRPAPPTTPWTRGPFQRGVRAGPARATTGCRDPAEVDAYVADPLSGDEVPLTVAYAAAVFALAVRAATPEAVAQLPDGLPVLLLSGELDPSAGRTRSRSPRSPSCSPSAGCRWSSMSIPTPATRSSTRPTGTRSPPT